MSISETATTFFDDLETGKGWDVCKKWCHEDASFSCQADAIAEITTVEGYAGWVKGLFTPVPDMHPEIKAFATDQERNTVAAFAVVHGTQHVGTIRPWPLRSRLFEAQAFSLIDASREACSGGSSEPPLSCVSGIGQCPVLALRDGSKAQGHVRFISAIDCVICATLRPMYA
jgi:hypothetical protein